jgi:FixJ family two-component response regulator
VVRALKSKLDIVRAHIAALTPREGEVFQLVIRGRTNKQVANAVGSTPNRQRQRLLYRRWETQDRFA